MSTRETVVVVGGGVAGAATAIQLAAAAVPPDVVLIDAAPRVGRGVAYGTASRVHLLNVPAARMSLFPGDPEHFLRWARRLLDADVAPDAFLPRCLYGDYVAATLTEASVRDDRRVIRVLRGTAVDLVPGSRATVVCANGARIAADRVVLALGNAAPADPPIADGARFYASRRYVRDPWGSGALDGIAAGDPVLLIGSGLTTYDVVLALRARGHVGRIDVVSRRGLRPRAHAAAPTAARPGPSPEHWLALPPTLAALVRAVRAACADSGDWRAVVDSLRPVIGALWERLDARDRGRFVARLRPFWDVHRHRAPRAVDRQIALLVAGGIVRPHVGRLRAFAEDAGGVTAVLGGETVHVAHVVNCTGPDTDVARSRDPLVRVLLSRGSIVRDRHGLGVETAGDGALVDADGRPSNVLFTIGTWRRPARWESVAVPELRVQAAELAQRMAMLAEARTLASSPTIPGSDRRAPAARGGSYEGAPAGELARIPALAL